MRIERCNYELHFVTKTVFLNNKSLQIGIFIFVNRQFILFYWLLIIHTSNHLMYNITVNLNHRSLEIWLSVVEKIFFSDL
jgi:hypothetical protein